MILRELGVPIDDSDDRSRKLSQPPGTQLSRARLVRSWPLPPCYPGPHGGHLQPTVVRSPSEPESRRALALAARVPWPGPYRQRWRADPGPAHGASGRCVHTRRARGPLTLRLAHAEGRWIERKRTCNRQAIFLLVSTGGFQRTDQTPVGFQKGSILPQNGKWKASRCSIVGERHGAHSGAT